MRASATPNVGFTLIELVIAMAIMSILAGIAYPAYQSAVRKGHRAEATAALMELAAGQERFYGRNYRYERTLTGLGYAADPLITENGRYSVTISSATPAAPSNPTAYTLQATPLGDQVHDLCGSYTFTSTGQKGMVGRGNAEACWQ